MSSDMIAGLNILVTGLVSAIAAAVVLVLNARAASKTKEATEKQNEYEKIISRYERDIQRREAHEGNQDELISKLREANATLRERYADVRGRFQMVYQYARRQAEFMRTKGLSPEPAPDIQEPSSGAGPEDTAFQAKQVEQERMMLRATRPGSSAPDPAHESRSQDPGEQRAADNPPESQ